MALIADRAYFGDRRVVCRARRKLASSEEVRKAYWAGKTQTGFAKKDETEGRCMWNQMTISG